MKRKVVKQGNNTLTITLPKKWTEEFGVKPGDELDIEEKEKNIIISTDYHLSRKKISFSIDSMERLAIAKFLMASYEQGYEEITLTFSKDTVNSWCHGNETIYDVINNFVARLIGFEVISQTKKSVTIGNITEKVSNEENVVSRVFYLLKEYLYQLIVCMKNSSYEELSQRECRHDTITKMISLATRIICEDNKYSKMHSINNFAILSVLDKATDFIRYAYKTTAEYGRKASENTIKLAEDCYGFIELYRHFYHKFSFETINEMDELRGKIKKKAALGKDKEMEIASTLNSLVEVLHGAIKPRIAIELVNMEIIRND
jgi:AbrB family looped-hinge helix DNA binding protein